MNAISPQTSTTIESVLPMLLLKDNENNLELMMYMMMAHQASFLVDSPSKQVFKLSKVILLTSKVLFPAPSY